MARPAPLDCILFCRLCRLSHRRDIGGRNALACLHQPQSERQGELIMAYHRALSRVIGNALLAASVLAIVVPAATVQAQPPGWQHGGGALVRQTRDVGHFTGLSLAISGDVEIRSGNTDSVIIEADDSLQALVETVVEGGMLRVRPSRRDQRLDMRNVKVIVSARNIERISVGGSGTVDVGNLRGRSIHFDVSGSGAINVHGMDSESVSVTLGGSGNFNASGETDRLQVTISGSGKVQAGQLAARDVAVNISGSGQATVWAHRSLDVRMAGSGDVGYYGDPRISRSIAGSGGIRRLGGSPH
jgi:hypothetical protein